MRLEACRRGISLRTVFQGKCSAGTHIYNCWNSIEIIKYYNSTLKANYTYQNQYYFEGPNPCNQVTCGSGQECETDKQGRASCGCPDYCEPIIRPVCASDRKTYQNLCEMNKRGCKRQTHLTVKYFGTCGKIHFVIVQSF